MTPCRHRLGLLAFGLVLAGALVDLGADPGARAPAGKKPQTQAEVEALIDKVGRTPPDWWEKVKLNFPRSLDLSWPEPAPPGPWNPQKNVGQFIWSVINENPARWKEGPKFMVHLMTVNKDRPEIVLRCMNQMGRMYYNLLEDWPRAAFWWRKAAAQAGSGAPNLELADCYWKLGCREMVEAIVKDIQLDDSRNCNVVKLWADLGEFDRAISMAEATAQAGRPDAAYLAAAEACRLAGKFDQALAYYQKVLEVQGKERDIERNQNRARASSEAVRLFDAFDLAKIPPGKYKAESLGYEEPLEVEVTIGPRKILDVKVTKHKEKQFYSALTDTPRRILERQSVKGVDATTGATITSEAIINATAKAVAPKAAVPPRK